MHRPLRLLCLRIALGLVVAAGCSSSDAPNSTDSAGKGGHAGTTGVAGSTGTAGSTGAAGASGTTGTAGTNAGAGTSGASGAAGGAGASAVGGYGAAAGAGSGGANATAGNGGGAGGGSGVGGGTGGAIAFGLTSPAFTEGMSFPMQNTCAGANTSPELDWTPGPAGTMSYAVVLTDLTNNFVHWAIWNIPADRARIARDAGDRRHLVEPGRGDASEPQRSERLHGPVSERRASHVPVSGARAERRHRCRDIVDVDAADVFDEREDFHRGQGNRLGKPHRHIERPTALTLVRSRAPARARAIAASANLVQRSASDPPRLHSRSRSIVKEHVCSTPR